MPPDASAPSSTTLPGHPVRTVEPGAGLVVPTQRGAGRLDGRSRVGDPEVVPTPEQVERLAEDLYNGLDPRFVDWEWRDATEGAREWARGRARRLLADHGAAPASVGETR